jgi:hypothetical protein
MSNCSHIPFGLSNTLENCKTPFDMASLGRTETFDQASADFRQHLPDLSIPRFTVAKSQDAHQYVADFKKNHIPPWLFNLTETWKELLAEPFKGVTNDGTKRS